MIFNQQPRFSSNKRLDSVLEDDEEKEEQELNQNSRVYMLPSTLSQRGTKIVDSYSNMGTTSL